MNRACSVTEGTDPETDSLSQQDWGWNPVHESAAWWGHWTDGSDAGLKRLLASSCWDKQLVMMKFWYTVCSMHCMHSHRTKQLYSHNEIRYIICNMHWKQTGRCTHCWIVWQSQCWARKHFEGMIVCIVIEPSSYIITMKFDTPYVTCTGSKQAGVCLIPITE